MMYGVTLTLTRHGAQLLQSHETDLYKAIELDFGKSVFDTYATELALIYNDIDYYRKNLSSLCKPKSVKTNLVNQPGKSKIYLDPLGNTLIIGAWNYPYHLSLLPAVAAIAAGNTCLIKPSELPANTMQVMAKLINNAFPSNYLYVVEGAVPETTELLKQRFDKIFFTGSPKVGQIVYEARSEERRVGKECRL